ncbi:hypothetical protein XM50_16975 [Sphingomonas sp. Ag1]|nr:hypothetical protein XM50_16975 [Sphingomonas sp. Ag1]
MTFALATAGADPFVLTSSWVSTAFGGASLFPDGVPVHLLTTDPSIIDPNSRAKHNAQSFTAMVALDAEITPFRLSFEYRPQVRRMLRTMARAISAATAGCTNPALAMVSQSEGKVSTMISTASAKGIAATVIHLAR